jgi:hypothetical protein
MRLSMAIYPVIWTLIIVSLCLKVVVTLVEICGLKVVQLIEALSELAQGQ